MTDPDWIKAPAESEKEGQIVANIASQFLTTMRFSSLK